MRMISAARAVILVFVCASTLTNAQDQPSTNQRGPSTQYTISLAKAQAHIITVRMDLDKGLPERQLQLPVWNALYQVRDFSQYVSWVKATDHQGRPQPVRKINKSLWQVSGAGNGIRITYEVYADVAGPYSAQLDAHHAFLNMADVLMYAVDSRSAALTVEFEDIPKGWKIATALTQCMPPRFCAPNYDRLVDSPFEVGTFREDDFDEGGARYRVVVDADPSDYDMGNLVKALRAIVKNATRWMDDRPFESYVFFYHFPRGPGGGGMEHAYGTAIEISAATLKESQDWFNDVSAHEFFHLWNVKRIRPQTLEPVDYTKENYTRALWFSEGVTSTVQGYILLQAGLLDERRYLQRLGDQITTLQQRSAHKTQSAEESSLDAWLEKYTYYREPDRSISYYNKGELLGVLLDLKIREGSQFTASLRELFQWMNKHYAGQGKFFDDSEGVRQAAQSVCRCDLQEFFDQYVSGTDEIPWDPMLLSVGLRVVQQSVEVADAGLDVQRVFGGMVILASVDPGSDAARAGVLAGDTLLSINGKAIGPDPRASLGAWRPGDTIRLRVRRGVDEHELKFKLGAKKQVEYVVRDVENLSAEQKAHREEWLKGKTREATHP
jgi:predicted metalloprotease with PDZ domain